jgi:anti-sigma regulatory factor (Ser/Thr protein kinase)
MGTDGDILHLVIEPNRDCARLAREAVLETFPAVTARDTLELVVSELVTNAYLHGEGAIEMSISRLDSTVCVVVSNHVSDPQVKLTAESAHLDSNSETENGRGLALIERLSQSWEYSVTGSRLSVRVFVTGLYS